MPTAFLLFGPVGSGKTTFAKRLEREHRAVRFTPDEWMSALFGDDPPAASFARNAQAISGLMQPIWMRCLELGTDVVLDYGLWHRSERDRMRDLVGSVGAEPILYWLRCPEEEARRRVSLRNGEPGRTLTIAPATFDLLNARVEPLGIDEPHQVRWTS